MRHDVSQPSRRLAPPQIVGLAAVGLLILLAVAAFAASRPRYPDAAQAIANVARLKRGQNIGTAIRTLHPDRAADTSTTISYRSDPTNGTELIHGLSPDRHLVIVVAPPKPTSWKGDVEIVRWTLKEGPAPVEDVAIGRYLELGSTRLFY